LNIAFDNKIKRGSEFKFMWVDATIEKSWGDLFKFTGATPKVYVFNPGKRKRFLVHEGELSFKELSNNFKKLLN
jgi:hypothetical protein